MMTLLVQNHLFVRLKSDWLTSGAPLGGRFVVLFLFLQPAFTIMFTSSDAEWTHMFTKAVEHMATRAPFPLPCLSGGDVLITE